MKMFSWTKYGNVGWKRLLQALTKVSVILYEDPTAYQTLTLSLTQFHLFTTLTEGTYQTLCHRLQNQSAAYQTPCPHVNTALPAAAYKRRFGEYRVQYENERALTMIRW